MVTCINTNSALYRELKRFSTLPEILLKTYISMYLDSHNGRFPQIDELPGMDSTPAIKEDLKIREDGTSKIENILKFAGTSDLNLANIIINDKYKDLDVEITPLSTIAVVDIKPRPSIFQSNALLKNDFNLSDSKVFIRESLNKMAKTMGIKINHMSISAMKQVGILDTIPTAAQSSAFIFNGEIYINTDVATIDSKIHELMHIFLGSIKFKLPGLYNALVESVMNFDNIQALITNYPNRTLMDVLEEIFVEEFSKYVSGIDNNISKLDPDIVYLILYNVTRTLDTILMGDNSVRSINEETLYNSSLKEIAEIVNSSTMANAAHGYLEDALIHRTLANVKLELLENGDLREEC